MASGPVSRGPSASPPALPRGTPLRGRALLLKSGYRLELERYRPLDLALRQRRWDLFDLLLDAGGDLRSVDVHTVLNTYNVELYERFRASGYDLTDNAQGSPCRRRMVICGAPGIAFGPGEEAFLCDGLLTSLEH